MLVGPITYHIVQTNYTALSRGIQFGVLYDLRYPRLKILNSLKVKTSLL